jgi:hypothetical protein
MTKPCIRCGATERYPGNKRCAPCSRASAKKWNHEHAEQHRGTARQWKQENAERVREHDRKRRAVDRDAYNTRIRNRNRARFLPVPSRVEPFECECCGGPPGRRALALDHDHTTGKFRGWLCTNCNTGIGKLGDSLVGVLRAVRYLKAAQQ